MHKFNISKTLCNANEYHQVVVKKKTCAEEPNLQRKFNTENVALHRHFTSGGQCQRMQAKCNWVNIQAIRGTKHVTKNCRMTSLELAKARST